MKKQITIICICYLLLICIIPVSVSSECISINKTIPVVDETNPPEIVDVNGGLGLKITIKTSDESIYYEINIDGLVLVGGSTTGKINVDTEVTIMLFMFGLGKIHFVVTANYVIAHQILGKYEAFMVGPFIFNIEEIFG